VSHGLLYAVEEKAKHQRIDGGANGLVQDELDDGVFHIKLGLDKLALAGLAVELFLIGAGG
jgi:hypothetical protein